MQNPSTEILDAGTVSTKSPLDKGVFEHTDPTKCPDDKGISELERLLKQKTFTKKVSAGFLNYQTMNLLAQIN